MLSIKVASKKVCHMIKSESFPRDTGSSLSYLLVAKACRHPPPKNCYNKKSQETTFLYIKDELSLPVILPPDRTIDFHVYWTKLKIHTQNVRVSMKKYSQNCIILLYR